MPKPTKRALKRKPSAIVILTFMVSGDKSIDLTQHLADFEWFQEQSALDSHWQKLSAYYADDVKDEGDLAYMLLEVMDAKSDPISIGKVEVFPAKVGDAKKDVVNGDALKAFKALAKKAKDEPETVWLEDPPPQQRKAKAPGKVKARAKNSAAKVVQKDDGGRKGVRRAVRRDPDKAKALKQRLAEKKDQPADEQAALDAALASA